MPRRGTWEKRNAGYKERQAAKFAAAGTDAARLAAAVDWLRASAALLARRRVPRGWSQEANRAAAARLARGAAVHLAELAQAIDRGDYDAGKGSP